MGLRSSSQRFMPCMLVARRNIFSTSSVWPLRSASNSANRMRAVCISLSKISNRFVELLHHGVMIPGDQRNPQHKPERLPPDAIASRTDSSCSELPPSAEQIIDQGCGLPTVPFLELNRRGR